MQKLWQNCQRSIQNSLNYNLNYRTCRKVSVFNNDKSTREFLLVNCEWKNKTHAIIETPNVQHIHGALNQSALLPLSKTVCSVTSHIVKYKNPFPSIFTFFCFLAYGGSSISFFEKIAFHRFLPSHRLCNS